MISHAYPNDLPERLRLRISRLSFPAFAFLVARVLASEGIEGVRLERRLRFLNGSLGDGYDMSAVDPRGFPDRRVLINLKLGRDNSNVARRNVDELMGAVERKNADYGIIATPGTFSREAIAAAQEGGPPIRLLDGRELARTMLAKNMGVAESYGILHREKVLDVFEESFTFLESHALSHVRRTEGPLDLIY